jgi:DNA polymerase-3 subunit gamma/tau
MSYQVLARKYRPQRFSEVIGQDHVTRTLKNAIEQQRIAHGYIFSGHRGIGKTTIARILAMALNCRAADRPQPEPCGVCDSCVEIRSGGAFDVIEIDAATNRGIDEVRRIREEARSQPARDRYKIFILDEAHQITDAAFNAILKTLEEPPPWAVFMMATTQPEDIPQTIRSRCQHFSFHAVSFDNIVGQLRAIAKQENIQADEEALAVLAEAGDGSMRDALSIMDQSIAASDLPARLTGEQVRGLMGNVSSEILEETMDHIVSGSSEELLRLLNRLLTEGQSPTHLAKQLVRFLRNALMAKVAGPESSLLQISSDERARVARVAERFSEEDLTRFLQIMLRTHDELGYRPEQRFHLELGMLKMVHAQRLLPLEQLLSQSASLDAPPPSKSRPTAGPVRSAAQSSSARNELKDAAPSQAQRTISPFDADRARKSRPPGSEMSSFTPPASNNAWRSEAASWAGTSVAAVALQITDENLIQEGALTESESLSAPPISSESIREGVLRMLESEGHRMPVSLLESGEWTLSGNELMVKVATPEKMIELAVNADVKRIANFAATQEAGVPMKLRVVSGGNPQSPPAPSNGTMRVHSGGARERAAADPVVRRMQEKFGAEVRSVIDHRERRK